MKNNYTAIGFFILFIIIGFMGGVFYQHVKVRMENMQQNSLNIQSRTPDSALIRWKEDFRLVDIRSTYDGLIQKAYFYSSNCTLPQPLIISLHTWSFDYTQTDPLAELCVSENINYIHPDFRGLNNRPEACCSEAALSDIDDAISYALRNANVDTSRICMIGLSGGGFATLCMFMKSKHRISKFSAWVPISDLKAWYAESRIRKNGYEEDILKCTGSQNGILDVSEALRRSPLYWETPVYKIPATELKIYTGVYDGIQGSVPITHSINFYNKVLSDLPDVPVDKFVSTEEKLFLLERCGPAGQYGSISGREVCLKKEYMGIKLTVFTGNHEMLSGYAFNELLGRE
jgi:hypothetical protein